MKNLNNSLKPGDILHNKDLFEKNKWFLVLKTNKEFWNILSLSTNRTYIWFLDQRGREAEIFFDYMKKVSLEETKTQTKGKEKE